MLEKKLYIYNFFSYFVTLTIYYKEMIEFEYIANFLVIKYFIAKSF